MSLSSYPLLFSLAIFFFVSSILIFFKYLNIIFIISILLLLYILFLWFKDISMEGSCGYHNIYVQDGLKFGMILFVFSEVMFFFSVFWIFFDSALVPVLDNGELWPPYGTTQFNPYSLPLLNSFILLSSAISLTWSHHLFLSKNSVFSGIFLTVFLSFFFLMVQSYEYYSSFLTIGCSIYGSIFFFSTGFHGLHVMFGTFFIIISSIRLWLKHFNMMNQLGFEFSILYWHFVDVIWLFLYIFVYSWSYF